PSSTGSTRRGAGATGEEPSHAAATEQRDPRGRDPARGRSAVLPNLFQVRRLTPEGTVMAATTPTTTSAAGAPTATKRLGLTQYFGYASGDAANNLAFSMSSFFLLLYYTDVAGISAAAVGTMFLVVRFWDAFTDLFAGRLVDKAQTRWGKFRPFILFGALPLLLMSVAVFSIPNGLHGTAGA